MIAAYFSGQRGCYPKTMMLRKKLDKAVVSLKIVHVFIVCGFLQ